MLIFIMPMMTVHHQSQVSKCFFKNKCNIFSCCPVYNWRHCYQTCSTYLICHIPQPTSQWWISCYLFFPIHHFSRLWGPEASHTSSCMYSPMKCWKGCFIFITVHIFTISTEARRYNGILCLNWGYMHVTYVDLLIPDTILYCCYPVFYY